MKTRQVQLSLFALALTVVAALVPGSLRAQTPEFLLAWGSHGSAPGQFRGPMAVAVDAAGDVFVGDGGSHGLQKFTSTGAFLSEWRQGFGSGLEAIDGIDFDGDGNVYVANTPPARVDKLTSAGTPVARFIHPGFVNYANPLGVAVDAAGRVYLLEGSYEQIAIFDPGGSIAGVFGSYGEAEGQFDFPYGLALEASDHLYVADFGNYRIQKFGPYGATPAHTSTWGRLKGLYR